jgi:O-antigen ligase
MYLRLFGLVLVIAVLVYAARRCHPTRFGLVFGLLMFYIPLHNKIPFNALPMVNALTAATVLLIVLLPGDRGPVLRHASSFRSLVLAFCMLSVFGMALASSAAPSFKDLIVEFKRWLDPVVFGLLALAITKDDDRRFVITCMMIGYTLVAVHGVREGIDYGAHKRIPGLLGQPNETAAFLAMYAPFGLTLALLLLHGRLRVALIGITCLGGSALVMTQSRGAMIAYGMATIVALVAAKRRGLAMAGIAVLLILPWMPELLPERLTSRFEETVLDDTQAAGESLEDTLEASSANRITQWKSSIGAMLSNPVGAGFGQFRRVIAGYGGIAGLDAHNFFLLVGVEFGVIGFMLAVALFAKMAADAWAVAKGAVDPFMRVFGSAACAMIVAALIVNFFGSRLMQDQPSSYLWVIAAMTARAHDMLRDAPAGGGIETVPVTRRFRTIA